MFAYIKGSLEEKTNTYVVIDVFGVGYKIFMSLSSINNIGEIGNIVKVHTHYYVREDNISLYGFLTSEELKMFELLLSVSGVGAKSAITMLSNISPSDFALAIITNNISALTKIPGIGAKSAQRIILELKDKIKNEDAISKSNENIIKQKENENTKDALDALQILGYNKKEIEKAFDKIEIEEMSTEDIIKNALKLL
ncbi:MAG: Holliday junction branch migration protein RuvA [Candidatus Scatovivens sp.]